jgi:nicotinamidase-related amidase
MMARDLSRTALLLLEYQVDVCAAGGKMVNQDEAVLARFLDARRTAGEALFACRSGRLPGLHLLHVGNGFEPGYPELRDARQSAFTQYMQMSGAFVRGEPGAAFVPEVEPAADEAVLWKHTISSFVGTDLPAWLNRRSIDTVVLAGVVTHYAVLSAAISAFDLGYRVLILEDACMSGDIARHETALEILEPLVERLRTANWLAAR